MKKNILASIGLTALFAVGIISLNVVSNAGTTSVYARSSGSPGGKTNSQGDIAAGTPGNCTECHMGSPLNTIGGSALPGITVVPDVSAGYTPFLTYTIAVNMLSASGVNTFGFELTAEEATTDTKVGTFTIIDAIRTKMVGTGAVTHEMAGTTTTTPGATSWAVEWQAPGPGAGNITLFAAINAANGNGLETGDQIYARNLTMIEGAPNGVAEQSDAASTTIFPNPVKNSFEIVTSKAIDNVVVYNLAGKKMSGVNQIANKFDASNLPAGIYFIQIESEGNVITRKVIKD